MGEHIALRVSRALLELIDEYARRLTTLSPATPATRSDAIRNLIIRGLRDAGLAPEGLLV